jgi:hypothetical protein
MLWEGVPMVAVERTSRYVDLPCAICHERIRPGDLVLPSIRNGERRVIHAHVCKRSPDPGPSRRVPVAAVA